LALLRSLTHVLSQPGDIFRSAGEVVLHLLEAAGLPCGVLYVTHRDGRVHLLDQVGLPEAQQEGAGQGFGASAALVRLAFADGPRGFVRGAPDVEPDLGAVLEGLGRRWVLGVPLTREEDRRGLLLLASDERDLAQPAWATFGRELADQF